MCHFLVSKLNINKLYFLCRHLCLSIIVPVYYCLFLFFFYLLTPKWHIHANTKLGPYSLKMYNIRHYKNIITWKLQHTQPHKCQCKKQLNRSHYTAILSFILILQPGSQICSQSSMQGVTGVHPGCIYPLTLSADGHPAVQPGREQREGWKEKCAG